MHVEVHPVDHLRRQLVRVAQLDAAVDHRVHHKAAGERLLRDSSLNWTLVYPVLLTNGPHTGSYRSGESLELTGMPRVSRADVADFMVSQLSSLAYKRAVAVVSSAK